MKADPRLKQGFGKIIRHLRLERDESQEFVAHSCDLERAYISRLERGISEPSIGVIFLLAEHFGINPGDLMHKVQAAIRPKK